LQFRSRGKRNKDGAAVGGKVISSLTQHYTKTRTLNLHYTMHGISMMWLTP
jgi:hypothetical protein